MWLRSFKEHLNYEIFRRPDSKARIGNVTETSHGTIAILPLYHENFAEPSSTSHTLNRQLDFVLSKSKDWPASSANFSYVPRCRRSRRRLHAMTRLMLLPQLPLHVLSSPSSLSTSGSATGHYTLPMAHDSTNTLHAGTSQTRASKLGKCCMRQASRHPHWSTCGKSTIASFHRVNSSHI